jgi:hypothetical protein
MKAKATGSGESQHDRFPETARKLGCDEDKERFEAKLGKIAKAKPCAKTSAKSGARSE